MINSIGTIIRLFISQNNSSKRYEKNFVKVAKGGVLLDKFYDKNINRSILITSSKAYEIIKQEKIEVKFGDLGENLLVDFDPYKLKIGTKLKIGEVILEVTQHCTLCNSLQKIGNCVPKLIQNDRGIFTKVINNGIITKDNTIRIIE